MKQKLIETVLRVALYCRVSHEQRDARPYDAVE